MNYDQVIELDNVTLEDCVKLFERKNKHVIINDGRIISWEE